MSDETDQWSTDTRDWMRGNLKRAMVHFGLVAAGEPRWGWRLRSISTAARGSNGPCWLRVGAEYTEHIDHPDVGDFWTGSPDSNAIPGIAKPVVLASHEWDHPDRGQRVRADVMTLLPGQVCSPTDVLRTDLDLPNSWWTLLRHAFEAVQAVPTTRFAGRNPNATNDKVRTQLGIEPPPIQRWETSHRDIHWANLLAPEFGLLDWEMWGVAAAGTDAARLHAHSLLVPDVARRVHETFADILDTPDGRVAQIQVAARLLHRAPREYPDLIAPVGEHIGALLGGSRSRYCSFV